MKSGLLDVDDVHRLFWQESGHPAGIPALFLHGGPGGTLGTGTYRGRFDPSLFRVIGLDQRGCGRSTPHVTAPGYEIQRNTTAQLVSDIEALREHLGVERWLVNGVSWGSTLAFAYAQAHPGRVLGLVLAAVTTTSRAEVDWITETVGAIYPEAWDRFAGHAERAGVGYRRGAGRLVTAYARLMSDPDPAVRDAASRAWVDWEAHHVSIGAGAVRRDPRFDDDEFRHAFVMLAAHYWSHDGFLDPPVLDRVERLHGIPATLLHGRRDISSPLATAWRLHRAWPASELIVDESDGHGGAGIKDSWVAANSRHASRIVGTAPSEV